MGATPKTFAETVSIAVGCSCCGGGRIAFLGAPRDETEVLCADCGVSLGNWAEVKEQARAAMADALRDDFQNVVAQALVGPRPRRPDPSDRLAA